MIILAVLLTALSAMIFVSQQADSYQTIASRMSQYDIQRFSENLVANYPGLIPPLGSTTCGLSSCYRYTMSLSNVGGSTNAGSSGSTGGSAGGVGVQIVRIYVNSTGSGCAFPNYCVLDPATTATANRFRMADSFLNPGEYSHNVTFWLPATIGLLPNPNPPAPMNSVYIVTSRGRVFTFQWPFPPLGTALGGQSGASISTGIMKVAYQGEYDSKNEGSGTNGYCHSEQQQAYPAGPGYKEVLTGITGVTGNSLTFVNPWITDTILQTAYFSPSNPTTTVYLYASVINTRGVIETVRGGNLVIVTAAAGENSKEYFLGADFFGTYYKGIFYAAGSSPSIGPNDNFYLIFVLSGSAEHIGNGAAGLLFTGTAAFTNELQDTTYSGGEVLLDGLYDRTSCTSP